MPAIPYLNLIQLINLASIVNNASSLVIALINVGTYVMILFLKEFLCHDMSCLMKDFFQQRIHAKLLNLLPKLLQYKYLLSYLSLNLVQISIPHSHMPRVPLCSDPKHPPSPHQDASPDPISNLPHHNPSQTYPIIPHLPLVLVCLTQIHNTHRLHTPSLVHNM